jgi:hypothetical protein
MTNNKTLPIRSADKSQLAGSQSLLGKSVPTAKSVAKTKTKLSPPESAVQPQPLFNDIQLSKIMFDCHMDSDTKRYFKTITPNVDFNTDFRIENIEEFETSGGIEWTASMLRNGVVVGEVENRGDGGCNLYHFNNREDRQTWESHATLAYLGRSTGDDEDSLCTFLDYLQPAQSTSSRASEA